MRDFSNGFTLSAFLSVVIFFLKANSSDAFSRPAFTRVFSPPTPRFKEESIYLHGSRSFSRPVSLMATGGRIIHTSPPLDDSEPEPSLFYDATSQSYIEVYIDHIAELGDGSRFHIGVPCDYAVALCYLEDDALVPVELGSDLMTEIFPIAETLIEDEFGDELILQNTPQTLTLVGELDLDNEEDEDEDDDDDLSEGEEEVEMLLTFDHEDKEYTLVRLLDPVLLVARDPISQESGVMEHEMLAPDESDTIIPELEKIFMDDF